MPGSAIYLYCVMKAAARPSVARVPAGVPGAGPLRAIDAGRSLWLIASEVPLDLYGPEPLEGTLRDVQQVSAIAVSHDAMIEHFTRRRGGTVIPMKLFTMFSTAERAIAETRSRRRQIEAVLKRIAGCEEWGVRVSLGDGSARARIPPGRAATGAAFLAAKKHARDRVRDAAIAAAEAADTAYDALVAVARDARRRLDTPAAAAAPPLLDAAFLVPTGRRAAFKAAARKAAGGCARAGAAMTLTGPWPAYNFAQASDASR